MSINPTDEVPPFELEDEVDEPYGEPDPAPEIPKFEGKEVAGTEVKFTGLASIDDVNGLVLGTDDRVRIVVEARVTSVKHYVDKNGQLQREQTVKAISAGFVPFDPTDPNDIGIIRA